MPVVPRLAAPPLPAPSVRRTPQLVPSHPRLPSSPSHCSSCSSWNSRRRLPQGPWATAADGPSEGSGVKVSRNCILLHTPFESPDLQVGLSKNGFNGNRLSLWVLQGLPLSTTTSLENLLLVISNLAMKGSIFIGELPHFPDWTAPMDMGLEQENLEKLFFTQGFRVTFVHYDNVAKDIGLDPATTWDQRGKVLFVAEQLRFSDAQMESFRMHFERIEEDADEEGFEEL